MLDGMTLLLVAQPISYCLNKLKFLESKLNLLSLTKSMYKP